MSQKAWRWVCVVLAVPGIVGFFLPFMAGVSPLDAMLGFWPRGFYFGEVDIAVSGMLCALAFPIALFQVRRTFALKLTPIENRIGVVLGLVAAILVTVVWVWSATENDPWSQEDLRFLGILTVTTWLPTLVLIVVAIRHRHDITRNEVLCQAILIGAYLVNVAPWVVGLLIEEPWLLSERVFRDAQAVLQLVSGFYILFLACICYFVMLVILLKELPARRGERSVLA